MGNLWYNFDEQEYHNFALFKRLFIGNLWHKYDEYECHNVARRVRYFQLQLKGFIHNISSRHSQGDKFIWSTF